MLSLVIVLVVSDLTSHILGSNKRSFQSDRSCSLRLYFISRQRLMRFLILFWQVMLVIGALGRSLCPIDGLLVCF